MYYKTIIKINVIKDLLNNIGLKIYFLSRTKPVQFCSFLVSA